MPVFLYKARTSDGEATGGEITADDRRSALLELDQQGLHITALRELNQAPAATVAQPAAPGLSSFATYVPPARRAYFWRQAAQAMSSGFGLPETMTLLGEGRSALARFAARSRDEISRGATLSTLMAAEPGLFGPLEVGLIKAGEVGGSLDDQMIRLADGFEREVELRQSLQWRIWYLCAVGIVFIGSAFCVGVVAPALLHREQTPWGPAVLARTLVLLVGVGIGLGVLVFMRAGYVSNINLRAGIDQAKLLLPVVGGLFRKLSVARYCNALGQLVGAGVPPGEAAEIAAGTAGNLSMSRRLGRLGKPLRDGVPFSEALRGTGMFPPEVIQMVVTGEKSGSLDQMLDKLSHYYEAEVAAHTKTLVVVGYVLAVIAAGVFVLFYLYSGYVGMFNSWMDMS